MPVCPRCGRQMTGGAPHGPWPLQYECRCGHIEVPTQSGGTLSPRYVGEPSACNYTNARLALPPDDEE